MVDVSQSGPGVVPQRLLQAMNRRDIEEFVACFHEDYRSEGFLSGGPVRSWSFQGSNQVRQNWTENFEQVPDFQAELLRSAVDDETAWTEWRWHGTRNDGSTYEIRAVTLFGIREGQIGWGRLYVHDTGSGTEAAE